MKNKDVVGVILVGGKSSRMGKDKASLRFNDLRLVDQIAKVLTSSGVRKMKVKGGCEACGCGCPDEKCGADCANCDCGKKSEVQGGCCACSGGKIKGMVK
jgi:CTP:molybdopterin cytidylyltransferase MocA